MTCFHPNAAYQSLRLLANGRTEIVFSFPRNGHLYRKIQLPCGQCSGCRLERSRQWAIRCVHEASLFEDNCFITLTFDDKHLKSELVNGSLDVVIYQKFMKRLREYFRSRGRSRIRFFHCGEYGSITGRPHYHAILFNVDFDDKYLWSERHGGHRLYRSDTLESLWKFGFSSIGSVTFDSAAYVARYIMKKVNGDDAKEHYHRVVYDFETGEIIDQFDIKPEYVTMSRRPGIGREWFNNYCDDVYKDDFVIMNSKKFRPPKFYDSLFELISPEKFLTIKQQRELKAREHAANNTPERLAVREEVRLSAISRLIRPLED